MNFRAWRNTVTHTSSTLPIAILYVTEGCNLQCAMCSYRKPAPEELTLDELRSLAVDLRHLGLRRIVFSGGEPLVRKDLPAICELFRGARRTLLTNGLQLARRLPELHAHLDDYIVSLDGAVAVTHDRIRGARCYEQVIAGIAAAAAMSPRKRVTIRTVVQKQNFREVGALIDLAHTLGADAISFLAVDVLSSAFGRAASTPDASLLLGAEESEEFALSCAAILEARAADFQSGFIETPPERFRALPAYFGSWNGRNPPPVNHCNAPDVSAVITATGAVLPCFFLPAIGSIRRQPLRDILSSPRAREVRLQVRDYEPEPCHRCTCTLKITPARALLNRF
jgi:MoaA/NifB/PqqE/SkfB family radical SAM enzyme